MPLLRVRTGCLACRRRRKKCDERKPICRGCERNKLSCHWPHPDNNPKRRKKDTASRVSDTSITHNSPPKPSELRPGLPASLLPRSPQQQQHQQEEGEEEQQAVFDCASQPTTRADFDDIHSHLICQSAPQDTSYEPPELVLSLQTPSVSGSSDSAAPSSIGTSPLSSHQSTSLDGPLACFAAYQDIAANALPSDLSYLDQLPFLQHDDADDEGAVAAQVAPSALDVFGNSTCRRAATTLQIPTAISTSPDKTYIPRSVSMFPGLTGGSFDLLSHYLGITSLSMDNGSTEANPFTVLLIPLAFSSDLILHLILTQSAVHRVSRLAGETNDTASGYYTRSLQLFQKTITDYNQDQHPETINLTVSALIMCFIETARGDVNGTVFDHLMAAHWLVLASISNPNPMSKPLRDFLVEYYVYTATLSMVSIDARVSSQFLLGDEVQAHARNLTSNRYVGSLCGCWLELLLLIPNIFAIGRRFSAETEASRPVTADDFADFVDVQSRINSWSPLASVHPNVALAGRVFQQAMLIYLYTALQSLSSAANGRHESIIQSAVDEALSILDELPPSARVNTSLCWPIAVIGSCAGEETQRIRLCSRLDIMFAGIGLGNIRQTRVLLDHLWRMDSPDPWKICRVMQEHQIWISFA